MGSQTIFPGNSPGRFHGDEFGVAGRQVFQIQIDLAAEKPFAVAGQVDTEPSRTAGRFTGQWRRSSLSAPLQFLRASRRFQRTASFAIIGQYCITASIVRDGQMAVRRVRRGKLKGGFYA